MICKTMYLVEIIKHLSVYVSIYLCIYPPGYECMYVSVIYLSLLSQSREEI